MLFLLLLASCTQGRRADPQAPPAPTAAELEQASGEVERFIVFRRRLNESFREALASFRRRQAELGPLGEQRQAEQTKALFVEYAGQRRALIQRASGESGLGEARAGALQNALFAALEAPSLADPSLEQRHGAALIRAARAREAELRELKAQTREAEQPPPR